MIQARTQPCWYLADPTGAEYETGDGSAHLSTATEAADYARTTLGRDDLTPHPFPRPCTTVICDVHGVPLTDDVWSEAHFDDEDEAEQWLADPTEAKRCPAGHQLAA